MSISGQGLLIGVCFLPQLLLETEAFIPTIAKTRQTARRNFVITLQAAKLASYEKIKMHTCMQRRSLQTSLHSGCNCQNYCTIYHLHD
jgi:hypothetical protein